MSFRLVIVLIAFVLRIRCADAQSDVSFAPAGDESAEFQTEVLLTGLDNPTGVTLRPTDAKTGPYELFIAESGAARVLRVSTDATDKVDEVLVNFPLGTFGQQPAYRVGPLALAFVNRAKLIVSAKGDQPGKDFVGGYMLATDGTALSADTQDHLVGPMDENFAAQVDNLHLGSMAMGERMCYITTGGGSDQGWVLKSGVKANRLAFLQPTIEVRKKVASGAPGGIAVIPKPRPPYLVVGLMGSRETPADSRLAYFDPASGELAMSLATGLHDVISLAYSPTGQLYAADFSWHDEQSGGVYRIDDARINGQQACRAVKVASIVRPYGIAFVPDGSLLVTSFGKGENAMAGSLIKITGEL